MVSNPIWKGNNPLRGLTITMVNNHLLWDHPPSSKSQGDTTDLKLHGKCQRSSNRRTPLTTTAIRSCGIWEWYRKLMESRAPTGFKGSLESTFQQINMAKSGKSLFLIGDTSSVTVFFFPPIVMLVFLGVNPPCKDDKSLTLPRPSSTNTALTSPHQLKSQCGVMQQKRSPNCWSNKGNPVPKQQRWDVYLERMFWMSFREGNGV